MELKSILFNLFIEQIQIETGKWLMVQLPSSFQFCWVRFYVQLIEKLYEFISRFSFPFDIIYTFTLTEKKSHSKQFLKIVFVFLYRFKWNWKKNYNNGIKVEMVSLERETCKNVWLFLEFIIQSIRCHASLPLLKKKLEGFAFESCNNRFAHSNPLVGCLYSL